MNYEIANIITMKSSLTSSLAMMYANITYIPPI